MSSKILSPDKYKNLQPARLLWEKFDPASAPYRFTPSDYNEAILWQQRVRTKLSEKIGFQDLPSPPVTSQLIEKIDCGDYMREKILLRTSKHIDMPVYLLIPKNIESQRRCVIAFHGHGYGVKDIVGLWEDGSERKNPEGYHKDFAISLCRQGFAVAVPEISCFGERQTEFKYLDQSLGQPVPTTCTHTAFLAFYLGGTAVGLRVFDGKRLIDYLQTRPEFDTTRLGAMGISGGGMHTFYSACLDSRIKACVVSGYYSTFAASILAMNHCPCNFIPGLGIFGEMYDLVGLIAPRPMLVEAASRDPIFPIEAVRQSVSRAQMVYKTLNAEENICVDFFEGRHQISGRIMDWKLLAPYVALYISMNYGFVLMT